MIWKNCNGIHLVAAAKRGRNGLYAEKEGVVLYIEKDKIYDCLYGLAVGDALSVPYEFAPWHQTEAMERIDMQYSSFFHQVPAGAWSDDTSMALAVMDSIAHTGTIDVEDMMRCFLQWFQMAKYTSTGITFGVGDTVYRAMQSYQNGIPIDNCGRRREHDNGNGSLMRALRLWHFSVPTGNCLAHRKWSWSTWRAPSPMPMISARWVA